MKAIVGAATVVAGMLGGLVALPMLGLIVMAAGSGAGAGAGATSVAGSVGPAASGLVAAEWAVSQVGVPYRWGATGPDAYDCSGLVLRAWQVAGVTLPRVAAAQYDAGAHVRYAEASVGDLVFFGPSAADPSEIDHVGIYLGAGMMVDAPHPGATVRVEAVWSVGLMPLATHPVIS